MPTCLLAEPEQLLHSILNRAVHMIVSVQYKGTIYKYSLLRNQMTTRAPETSLTIVSCKHTKIGVRVKADAGR